MSHRVIKDSDDEDATSESEVQSSINPHSRAEQGPQCSPTQDSESITIQPNTQNILFTTPGTQESRSLSQLGVNFDDFVRSESTRQVSLSSSSQQKEGWVSQGVENGSIGAMMTEIGIAQSRLLDEGDAMFTAQRLLSTPTTMDLFCAGGSVQVTQEFGFTPPHVGEPKQSTPREPEHDDPDATIPQAEADDKIARYGHAYEPGNIPAEWLGVYHGRFDLLLQGPSFNTSMNPDSSTSYNYFESSLKASMKTTAGHSLPMELHNGDCVSDLHRTYVRPCSMQEITTCSPHDTEPLSSLVSPGLTRARTDNAGIESRAQNQSQNGTNNDLSVPVAVEVSAISKESGRQKQQVAISSGDHEIANTDDPATSVREETPTRARIVGDTTDDLVFRPDDRDNSLAPGPALDAKFYSKDPVDLQDEKSRSHTVEFARPLEALEGCQMLGETQAVIEEPTQVQSRKRLTKQPRKKKLKRGKTTSVVLKKTYESDVEDDVIWIDEKRSDHVPPEMKSHQTPEVQQIERTKLDVSAAVQSNATDSVNVSKNTVSDTLAADETPIATMASNSATVKKYARKRKRTADIEQAHESPIVERHLGISQVEKVHPAVLADIGNNVQNHKFSPTFDTKNEDTTGPGLSCSSTKQQGPDSSESQSKFNQTNGVPVTPEKATSASFAVDQDSPSSVPNESYKGPDKHSPISRTSKVPYRVGLSKRARISPLLRIVRK